jgi:ribosome modulation factor
MRKLDNPIWNKGYEAYAEGVSRNENPYKEDTQAFDDWQEGWDCADSDFDDEQK